MATWLAIEVDGRVAGCIMGEVYMGEFGVPETMAAVDTLCVDPAYPGRGVGTTLFEQHAAHLHKIGVRAVTTRVNCNSWGLLPFFNEIGYAPVKVENLELAL